MIEKNLKIKALFLPLDYAVVVLAGDHVYVTYE